mgnify:FL=1
MTYVSPKRSRRAKINDILTWIVVVIVLAPIVWMLGYMVYRAFTP